jgi:hypothetical protein
MELKAFLYDITPNNTIGIIVNRNPEINFARILLKKFNLLGFSDLLLNIFSSEPGLAATLLCVLNFLLALVFPFKIVIQYAPPLDKKINSTFWLLDSQLKFF